MPLKGASPTVVIFNDVAWVKQVKRRSELCLAFDLNQLFTGSVDFVIVPVAGHPLRLSFSRLLRRLLK